VLQAATPVKAAAAPAAPVIFHKGHEGKFHCAGLTGYRLDDQPSRRLSRFQTGRRARGDAIFAVGERVLVLPRGPTLRADCRPHCQRPRRGITDLGHTPTLTRQPDNVARLSCSVSRRANDHSVYDVLTGRQPLSHVTVTRKVEPVRVRCRHGPSSPPRRNVKLRSGRSGPCGSPATARTYTRNHRRLVCVIGIAQAVNGSCRNTSSDGGGGGDAPLGVARAGCRRWWSAAGGASGAPPGGSAAGGAVGSGVHTLGMSEKSRRPRVLVPLRRRRGTRSPGPTR